MKYMAIIDADEKPVSCEFIGCNGNVAPYLIGATANIKPLEQESILDKIKAEILDEVEYAYADFDEYKKNVLLVEPDELPDDDFRYGLERAVEIINKYKAEREE